MFNPYVSNTRMRFGAAALCGIFLFSAVARAESYPEFSQKYWEDERDGAKGKMIRGAALGALGVISIAPTAVLTVKAVKNPRKFLAYSVISGIATLGLTFHGFFSISFGGEQRDKAEYFINQYKTDAASVDVVEERAYYLDTEKKSTRKMILFGAVLGAQGAILLANGIVLSIRKRKGLSIDGIKLWPSYLLGGLLFAGGATFVGLKAARYKQLGSLENQPISAANALLIRPYISADPVTASLEGGLIGQYAF